MSVEQTLAQMRILIVEDQTESRALLRGILSEMGVTQVFEATDGRTGLQFMDSAFDFIDLILCDWNMPAMTGIEFLRQVRSTGNEIPFMMITGRSDQGSVIEAKNHGVNGYIRKPYSPTQIEAKLRIMIQKLKAA
jgi:two-component system chemotaxis response regulator CheY